MLDTIPSDLILEILCKLKYDNLHILLVNKNINDLYINNKKYISRNIVSSYNKIFTDPSNILFLIKETDINPCSLDSAVFNGNLNDFNFIIKNDFTFHRLALNNVNYHKEIDSLLACAAFNNHYEITRILLDLGADPNANACLSLKFAVQYNHPEIIKLFFKKDAKFNIKNKNALEWAMKDAIDCGYLDIVKLLIDNSADVNSMRNCPLALAARTGRLDIVKLLIKNGAIDNTQCSALHYALCFNHIKIAKFLRKTFNYNGK